MVKIILRWGFTPPAPLFHQGLAFDPQGNLRVPFDSSPKLSPPVTLCLVVVNFFSKHNYQPILSMEGNFSKIKIGVITLNKEIDKENN